MAVVDFENNQLNPINDLVYLLLQFRFLLIKAKKDFLTTIWIYLSLNNSEINYDY